MEYTTFRKTQINDGHAWLVVLALILALAAGLIYGRLTTGHNWGDDFAGYIGQANSIAEGDVQDYLRQNTIIIQNSNTARHQYAPVSYPWGYPLLLAAIYPACGMEVFCLKLLNIPIYVTFLSVLYALLNRYLTRIESLLIVALFAVNPHILVYQDNLQSDLPFMLFSTLALWFMVHSQQNEGAKNNRRFQAWLGVALFLAFYIRTAGILLIASLLAMQSIQIIRQYFKTGRPALSLQVLIPYAIFGALFLISNALLPDANGSYLSGLHISKKDILYNLWLYQSRAFIFFDVLPSFLQVSWILLGLAVLGMALTMRRNSILVVYTLLTMGLYTVWPFPSARFLYGIAPCVVYFVYYPIRYGVEHLVVHETWRRAGLAILLTALGIYFGWHSVALVSSNLQNDRVLSDGPFTPQSTELFEYIRNETPQDSTIIFFKPRLLPLLTGRSAWLFNGCKSLSGSNYVVKIKDARFKSPDLDVLSKCAPASSFKIILENELFIVYQE